MRSEEIAREIWGDRELDSINSCYTVEVIHNGVTELSKLYERQIISRLATLLSQHYAEPKLPATLEQLIGGAADRITQEWIDTIEMDNAPPTGGQSTAIITAAIAPWVGEVREGIVALLTEKTIAGTILSAENRDMAFAKEVPQYDSDCQSIVDAANLARKALALLGEGSEEIK